jgi:hypothetical protein
MRGVEGALSKSDSASKNSASYMVRAVVRVEGVIDSTAVANVACERTLAGTASVREDDAVCMLCDADVAGTASVPNSFTVNEGEVAVSGERPDCLVFWVSDPSGSGFGL